MIKLSPREEEILALYLKEGGRIRPVAEALGSSVSTVRNQRASLMKKLYVKTPLELLRTAIKKGLIEP